MSDSRAIPFVLVHWNQPERCLATIDAFGAQTVPTRIVVVDNGSAPAAKEKLEADGRAEMIALGENRGFGPGANAGWRHVLATDAGAGWIGLAPHDALPEPDCVERLLDAVEHRPGAGLVCADFGDGTYPVVDDYLGGMVWPTDRTDGWQPAAYPHGTCMLARRACLEDVGMFDERYFAYVEEADLGRRAQAGGWEVGVALDAVVDNPYLAGGAPTVDYLQVRNTLLFVREHFGRYKGSIRLLIVCLGLLTARVPRLRPLVFDAPARRRAIRDHLRGRYGPPPPDLKR